MTKQPKFSIIIPCFNDADYAITAIESCTNQTYTNFEVIVVDDGSTDKNFAKLATHAAGYNNVKIFRQRNGGVSSARNNGLRNVTGNYIIFLDSDDLLGKNFLKNAASITESLTENKIIVTPYKYFPDTPDFEELARRKRLSFYPQLRFSRKINLNIIRTTNCFPISSCIISKSALDKIGGFDEDLKSMEDWDLWIRATAEGATFKYIKGDSEMATHIRIRNGLMRDHNTMIQYEYALVSKHSLKAFSIIKKYKPLTHAHKLARAIAYILTATLTNTKTNLNGII